MEEISELKKPSLVLGDFNAITCSEEKVVGKALKRRSMLDFSNCINVFGNVNIQLKEAEMKVQEAMVNSNDNPFDEEKLDKLVTAQNEQAQNYISELEDGNGNIISDQKRIAELLVNHFEDKFKFQKTEANNSLLEVIPKIITAEDQEMLDVIPSFEEIRNTIFSMDPDSSPGPDGFSGFFYKECWKIIQEDVFHAIQFCWNKRFIPKGLNSSFLFLIPKVQGAKSPNQFRPIGLSNVSFKIITKIITTRMSTLMEKLVAPQQAAYIKGRNIQEVLLASEMVNEMKKKRRGGNVGFNLDISEAYDSVRWEFLFQLLQRGLRQGDPLSPILFVLMEEMMSSSSAMEQKKCMQYLLKLLEDYQKSSGQIINKSKSKIFIDGTTELRKTVIQDLMQMQRSEFPDKYLGVILSAGRVKSSMVWPMVEMLQGKLDAWKGRILSFQERNFLWSGDGDVRKFKTLSWEKVCTPFEKGGLGIQRLEIINRALLMKMIWKILHSKEECATFFKAKYIDKNGQWSTKWKLSSVWPGLKWA
ncbi:uncharacterized protein LOC113294818 [Papaver somniferum]|uniref:uncharacterized protein LOC113294818 n=1 Tax=Papaver somniferum TaxID=3469 RepID=UPI000E700EA2|nr:uncharacterized protein LOC113294818 [Papaver somniferum]